MVNFLVQSISLFLYLSLDSNFIGILLKFVSQSLDYKSCASLNVEVGFFGLVLGLEQVNFQDLLLD
jgi:hypothetical protein